MKGELILLILVLVLGNACNGTSPTNTFLPTEEMKIRIAELEIDANYIEEYTSILKEEAAKSIELEDGVICIFPMYEKENPNLIRLLEIYKNEDAYQSHLKTPHFLHYKKTTLPMVKSLKLIDMSTIDAESIPLIFRKISAQVGS